MTEEEQSEKDNLSENMRKKSPQMYRKLKWEELMRVTLKEENNESIPVNTIIYGSIFMKKQVYEAMQVG